MLKYIIRRIIAMIPVVIGITFLVFMIMQLAPGDPVQMILGDNASPEAVEAQVETAELTAVIQDFLDTLERENRAVFLGRYWMAFSYEEIAARTGLSQRVVSVRLVRLRKRLRKYLTERGCL